MDEKQGKLQKIIDSSKSTVFFGGAGVSTESGLPDFRSTGGLYYQQFDYPPETILSRQFFYQHTKEFYQFYREKINISNVLPNKAHIKLAAMEAKGILKGIITQNIDGLHQKAGSRHVVELHGSVKRNYCLACHQLYTEDYIFNSQKLPVCSCGGLIKPDVTLYGEQLKPESMSQAIKLIKNADTLIIGGTSLVVYPAAGLIEYFAGKEIVLINQSETPKDGLASLVIREAIGKVFDLIKC